MGEEFKISLLNIDSLEDQVKVYMEAFSSTADFNEIREKWLNKHYRNPVHQSYIFGAYDGELLVSINAYMPLIYEMDGTTYDVIESCESGTLKAYRGRGLWSKVVKTAISYFTEEGTYDFLIGFPNYSNSYNGFMKMGWDHTTEVVNQIMISNGDQFIKRITGRNVRLFKWLKVQQMLVKIKSKSKKNKFFVSNDGMTEKELESGFNLLLTSPFLDWKKSYRGMHSFGLYNNDKQIASCRYAIDTNSSIKTIRLYSIGIDKKYTGNVSRVYSYCINEILTQNKDVAFIRSWAVKNSNHYRALSKIGFIKSKHKNPFITYQLKRNLSIDIRDKKLWQNLTFMDLD